MKINVRIIAVIAVIVGLFAWVSPLAGANDQPVNTLKVSPVRTDIEVLPGESKAVQATVTNLTDAEITVRALTNDFIAGDEWGTPSLILDENEFAPTHSLKRFMGPLPDVAIPARQARTVEVLITVPESAQAGGYFGAVRFAPTTPNSGGQVNMNASVASLILLTVPGDITEKIELTDFNIEQDRKSGTYFNSSNDLHAAFRFENKGNVQIGPFGKISVKKGDTVVHEEDFNNKDLRDMILPDSARRWEIPLKNIGSFGKYTVSAVFTYGTTNQTIEVTKSFWVVPMSVIIATIIIILAIVALILGVWTFLRGYKKRILRKNASNSGSERS